MSSTFNSVAHKPQRILSIDIMRGLTLFLMLFVNDLYLPAAPLWIGHTAADVDGMGLADWVFPGFLFMVGMAVPYALRSRKKLGHSKMKIFQHIVIRTVSLLLMGVLVVNIDRLNPALTGMNAYLWAVLVYISLFLVWNQYPESERWKRFFMGLKASGIVGLIILAYIFRAGEPGNTSWLIIRWWGILGLIGWGYFVSATVGLWIGEKLWPTVAVWLAFVLLNMFSHWGIIDMLDFLNPMLGVILDGNVPSIVLAGLVTSLLLSKSPQPTTRIVALIAVLGVACVGMGFFLRQWFILSKIHGTPSWAMVCNGISMLLYALLYLLVDCWGKSRWAGLFQAAGKNSLTTYLAPDIVYYTAWGLSIPLFFYKQQTSQLLAISGSLVWALAMIGFAILLSKVNIRLKL